MPMEAATVPRCHDANPQEGNVEQPFSTGKVHVVELGEVPIVPLLYEAGTTCAMQQCSRRQRSRQSSNA
jgi:hypothetical protein